MAYKSTVIHSTKYSLGGDLENFFKKLPRHAEIVSTNLTYESEGRFVNGHGILDSRPTVLIVWKE